MFAPRDGRWRLNAVDRLAAALGELAGAGGRARAAERPGARRLRDERRAPQRADGTAAPPRELAEELAAKASSLPRGRARRGRRARASSTCWLDRRVLRRGARRDRRGLRRAARRDAAERIQVEMVSANPTGPITVASARNGAYGDSVARLLEFAGHTVEREYYYNDAGAQMDRFRASVEAARRGEEPPEDGYHGDVRRRARARARATRCRGCSSGSRRRSSASASTSTRGRGRATLERALPGLLARLPTYEHDGATFVRSTRLRRREGPRARPLGREGRPADVRGGRRRVPREQARARLRPRDLRPRRRPPRRRRLVRRWSRGCSATTRRGSRCCSTSSSTSPAAASRRRCRSAAATSSSSTSSWTRSASTPRAGTSSTAAPTRRSRSTSTSPPRRAQKNPVYYVQYAHARIAGHPPQRAATSPGERVTPTAPLEPPERELVKRLAEFPAVVREATERRGPQVHPGLRDQGRRRLPPLLPRRPRARLRRRGVPARRSAVRRSR